MQYLRVGGLILVAAFAIAGFGQVHWYPTEDVLTVWVRGSPEQSAIYRSIIDEFSALNPEAKVMLEQGHGQEEAHG